ncbi:hypothetical protein ACJIZ3_007451 [Penstemon smallii]|uniref:Uncharacterized protein n=1 Tax=Penstemon smallii TaxID=265156 RepID=A0ABD3SAU4_9LAMI
MKLLMDLFACWGSNSSSEEKRLLAALNEPQRLVGRKQGRMRADRGWRSSLSPISENNVLMVAERINNNSMNTDERQPVAAAAAAASGWSGLRRWFKGKFSSMSPRDHNCSSNFDLDDARRNPLSAIQPSFSPALFMF